jgi:hypothetical protein
VAVRPVLGLRIVRGRRRATENVPKPTSVTGSPRRSALRIAVSIARNARSVEDFGHPDAAAMRTTRSARVTPYIPKMRRASSITASVTDV